MSKQRPDNTAIIRWLLRNGSSSTWLSTGTECAESRDETTTATTDGRGNLRDEKSDGNKKKKTAGKYTYTRTRRFDYARIIFGLMSREKTRVFRVIISMRLISQHRRFRRVYTHVFVIRITIDACRRQLLLYSEHFETSSAVRCRYFLKYYHRHRRIRHSA